MSRWCLIAMMLLASCGAPTPPPEANDEPRIISLSPGITGTLEDVGLGPYLVGRSNWCRTRTRDIEDIPAVGDLHERNWEAILRIRPTHVFFQAEDVKTDQALVELAERHGWQLRAWPLRTVSEIQQVLVDLPAVIEFQDEQLQDGLASRCDQLVTSTSNSIRPVDIASGRRVLLINDGLPPLAWCEDSYLGELLEATGAENVAGQGGWKLLSMEDVVRLQPDLVFVVSEQETDSPPAILSGSGNAIQPEQCLQLVHPRINLPGPHLAETSSRMRVLLSGG
ncbi:MAG: ABC transporter substrate-binding protein [Phycisphaerales bacterium]|nr:ABC transporter substrate-binding protein [Phycisphaerales bacterium]